MKVYFYGDNLENINKKLLKNLMYNIKVIFLFMDYFECYFNMDLMFVCYNRIIVTTLLR